MMGEGGEGWRRRRAAEAEAKGTRHKKERTNLKTKAIIESKARKMTGSGNGALGNGGRAENGKRRREPRGRGP
jgi:hypothetical protein